MTDAEIVAELMSNLTEREKRIVEKENFNATREARLNERESELQTREANYQERNNLLTLRKQILDETENYWKNYKIDTLKNEVLIAIVSGVVGYAAGSTKR